MVKYFFADKLNQKIDLTLSSLLILVEAPLNNLYNLKYEKIRPSFSSKELQ